MKFWYLIIAVLVGMVLAYWLIPSPDPIYETVVVTVDRIIEREPDTVRTFVDRIVTVQADPIIIAVAEDGAREEVRAFCGPFAIEVSVGDTMLAASPSLLVRSVTYDRRWAFRKDRLLVTGPLNNGNLTAIDYEVRGDWSMRTIQSRATPLIQYPRTSLFYDLWEGSSQIFTVFMLGKLAFEAIN